MLTLNNLNARISSKDTQSKDVNTLKMLGIRLHKYSEPGYGINKDDVKITLGKIKEKHTEETNEVYNLIACQISKRQQERVNLCEIETDIEHVSIQSEQVKSPGIPVRGSRSTLNAFGGHSIESSPGNSPPRLSKLDMNPTKEAADTMKSSKKLLFLMQNNDSPGRTKTVNRAAIRPNVIYKKDTRDELLLMTEKNIKEVPVDKYGYFGGFSPERKPGTYHGSEIHKRAQKDDKDEFDRKKREAIEKEKKANEDKRSNSSVTSSYRGLQNFEFNGARRDSRASALGLMHPPILEN